jgi:hypothetical protein
MNPRGRVRVMMIAFACAVLLIWKFIPAKEDKILAMSIVAFAYFAWKFLLLKKKFSPDKK